jgi:hypothetical protein
MKNHISKIDAAFFILLLTGLSYGIAFAYQVGKKDYYNIPVEFIDLNLSSITRPVMAIIFLSFMLFGSYALIKDRYKFQWKFSIGSKNILFRAAFTIVFVLIFTTYLGIFSSYKKTEYLVINTDKTYVVIDYYKDLVIIAPVDLETKTIMPKFQFIEIKSTEKNPITFSLTKTGRLDVSNVRGD